MHVLVQQSKFSGLGSNDSMCVCTVYNTTICTHIICDGACIIYAD